MKPTSPSQEWLRLNIAPIRKELQYTAECLDVSMTTLLQAAWLVAKSNEKALFEECKTIEELKLSVHRAAAEKWRGMKKK